MGHSHGKHGAHPAKHAKTAKETGLPDVPVTHAANKVRRSAKNEREPSMAKTVMAVYDIESKVLGRGHYGVVRKCTHKMTGEKCAVKSISKKRISRPEVLKREVGILKAMAHPHIIAIRDVFEDDHHVFIVTELCTGGELFERIIGKTNSEEGHYSEHDAATIVRQVLDAVAYCHKQHVVHRDLKPENFLFSTPSADSTLKIIDFGLARIEELVDKDLDNSGAPVIDMHTRVGTPYYIAPEVLARNYTKACDLWSIGVITYILLCGYPPFNANSDVAIFERVKRGLTSKSFPPEDWDDVSKDAKDFISNLLDLDPEKRMTAAQALSHPWIAKQTDGSLSAETARALHITTADEPPKKKKRINGDQLANRLQNFLGMSKLKKVALNVLAHHLTEKEIAELSLIWRQVDKDNTGTITIAQLRHVLVQNGHNATEDEMLHFLQGMDTDGNKVIDYHEFAAALLARNQTIRDDRVKEIFENIDITHKGYVTLDDLVEIMGSKDHAREVLGDDFPDEQQIDFEHFKAKLQASNPDILGGK